MQDPSPFPPASPSTALLTQPTYQPLLQEEKRSRRLLEGEEKLFTTSPAISQAHTELAALPAEAEKTSASPPSSAWGPTGAQMGRGFAEPPEEAAVSRQHSTA